MNNVVEYTWPPQLPFEIALGIKPLEQILGQFNLSDTQWASIRDNLQFRSEVSKQMQELRENGLTFKHKARVLAESYLEDIDDIMMDAQTTKGQKLEIFKTMVECADLKPRKDTEKSGNGTSFAIQINLN